MSSVSAPAMGEPRAPGPRRPGLMLAVLLAGQFMVNVDIAVVNVAARPSGRICGRPAAPSNWSSPGTRWRTPSCW
ncbi:hypothetical protein ACFQY7_37635 [Actinomadura luteofluorescens]|uniref:hypothetical protein n=1 Tax=Actinomadura luteofluorescens TaxID=46163 RepID=UPI003645011D